MALAELARMLFVVNTILEKASLAVGLSKRAALALAILYLEDDPEATMTNQDLHDRLVEFKVSTDVSAKKDASAAKGELLVARYIEIRNRVSVFGLTSQGRDAASKMYDAMNEALEELEMSNEDRSVLRKLVGLSGPKLPAKPATSAAVGRTVRQKSS